MWKIKNEISKISWIWEKFNIEWFLNVHKTISKELSYSPLWNEIWIHENIDISASINIFKDNRKLILKIENVSLKNIEKLIKDNLFLLEISDKDEDNVLYPVNDKTFLDSRKFQINDIKWDFFVSQWEKIKNFQFKEKLSIEWFGYSLSEQESYFINSKGAYKEQQWSYCNYSLALFYNDENFSDSDYMVKYSTINDDITDDFLNEIQEKILKKTNPQESFLSSGSHDIVIKNELAAEFWELLMSACSWENIRQNQSFFNKDDIWKIITNKDISVISNPKKDDSVFNRLFDSEWITTEKITIIENWSLKNIFLNSKNAKKFNLKPTWNPDYANLEIIWKYDSDYLSGCSFVFTSFLWMHTIDSTTWKFALEWEWFEINDWKVWNFVKNVWFSWNIKDLFLNLDKIWNDTYTYWNVFSPSLSFKNQTLIF